MRKALFTGALALALPAAAIAQIAVLHIKVLEGEDAVHIAGARVARPLTVAVADERGQPVAGATVSFQLSAEGPGGLFTNGLHTDIALTDADGRAGIHALQLNRIAGQFRIRITAVKEQARAGAVVFQSIAESGGPAAAVAANAPAATAAERSARITPTTAKMRPHSSRKWIVLAALAAAGGGAYFGISHAGSGKSGPSSSVVSIGAPTISVGHP